MFKFVSACVSPMIFVGLREGKCLSCLNPMRGGVHMDKFFFDFLLIVMANIASGLIMLAIRGTLAKRKEKRCPPSKDEHR